MSRQDTISSILLRLTLLLLFITLVACQANVVSNVVQTEVAEEISIAGPTLSPSPIYTLTPTPTETPTPTITLTPTKAVYEILATNSIDSTVDLSTMKAQFLSKIEDYTKPSGMSYISTDGYILSYEYGKKGDENFFYILFGSPLGVIKVKVDIFYMWDFKMVYSVKDMDDQNMSKVINEINKFFLSSEGKTSTMTFTYGCYLSYMGIGSEQEASYCRNAWSELLSMSGEICPFDSSIGIPDNEIMMSNFSNTFIPILGTSVPYIMGYKYDIFIPDDNTQIVFALFERNFD